MLNQNNVYTTLGPTDLWRVYNNLDGLFRGGGNATSPKLIPADGPRAADFTMVYDPAEGCQMVIPNPSRGLSFADSIERLRGIPIIGRVWLLPKGAMLPEGLVFNYRAVDHPLLNVSRRMTVVDLTTKLTAVAALLKPTEATISRTKGSHK
jgi:hypothetical protein